MPNQESNPGSRPESARLSSPMEGVPYSYNRSKRKREKKEGEEDGRNKHRLVRHLTISAEFPWASVLHGMTPANRAKLRWRGRRKRREWMEKGEGEEGERCGVAKGEAREEEKLAGKGKKREEGGGEGEKKGEEKENGARASGLSLGPRVPRHGLVSLSSVRGQRSSSSTSHLRVLNLPSVLPTPV